MTDRCEPTNHVAHIVSFVFLCLVSYGLYMAIDYVRAFYFTFPLWILLIAVRLRWSPSKALPVVLLLILFQLAWMRLYVVKCRHLWRDQMLKEQATMVITSPSTTLNPASTDRDFLDAELHAYCENTTTTEGHTIKNHPKWTWSSLVGVTEDQEDLNEEGFQWGRINCWDWTCSFTEQRDGLGTKMLWFTLIAVVLNVIYVSPGKFGCPGVCVQLSQKWFGAGTCAPVALWFWILYIPSFLVCYVTWVPHFNYSNLIEESLHVFNIVVKDAQRILVIASCLALFFIIYWQRKKLYQLLDMDERNAIRFDFRDWYNPDWRAHRAEMYQICIWKVTSGPTEISADGTIEGTSGDHKEDSWVQTMGSFVTGNFGYQRLEREQGHLPGQNTKKSLFVRVCVGDEEPLATRVIYSKTITMNSVFIFKETFRMNRSNEYELYVDLRDQDVVGSHLISQKVFTIKDLERRLDHPESCQPYPPIASDEQQQVTAMHAQKPDADDQKMVEAGFRPYKMSEGGTIWVAFAKLQDENWGA